MRFFLLISVFIFSVTQFLIAGEKDSTKAQQTEYDYRNAPSIGYDLGYLNFFGDVKLNGYQPPFGTRLGHRFYIGFPLSNSFSLSYNFTAGKIFGEETRGSDNLNFRTSLVGQSLMLEYNFHNIIKPDNYAKFGILPVIGFGMQALVFRAKADMKNNQGKKYYYWDDGSIKDLPQTPGNIDLAIAIERDYTYESELRDANLDGFGKYSQITFAMPFYLGAEIKAGKNFRFRLGTTYHLTFSDMLDNLSSAGSGNRKGNEGNDMFLFSSLGIAYKFTSPKNKKTDAPDTDGDGIADIFDKCRDTPKGVKVDKNGCPAVNEKDRDGDGVLDIFDRCRDTKPGAPVDKEGCSEEQRKDDDGDGIINAFDKCPGTPDSVKVDASGCPVAIPKPVAEKPDTLKTEEPKTEPQVEETQPEPAKPVVETETKPADTQSAPESATKPKEVKGVMETEIRPVDAKATLETEEKPKAKPDFERGGKYHFADLNKNGTVELSELNHFIGLMEKGDERVTIQVIDEILEYYFKQD